MRHDSDARVAGHISNLVAQARANLKSNHSSSQYTASWLVEGAVGDGEWKVTAPGKSELTTIEFNRAMPDGTSLSDDTNRELLTTIQRWAFHLRMGGVASASRAFPRWIAHIVFSINIAAWLILHRSIFQPEKYGFRLLTKDSCKALLAELAEGSWTLALRYKSRLVVSLHESIESLYPVELLLSDIDNLPRPFVNEVTNFFEARKLYVPGSQDSNYENVLVSREYLSSVLGAPTAGFLSPNFRVFIRQFEPKLKHDSVLQSSTRRNRYLSQNSKLVAEAESLGVGASLFDDSVSLLKNFLSGHRKIPKEIPNISIDRKSVVNENLHLLKAEGHTKLIPLSIGLTAFDKAAEWIIMYGEAIVLSISYYVEEFLKIDEEYSLSKQSVKKQELFERTQHMWLTKAIEGVSSKRLDAALNITQLQTKKRKNFPEDQNHYLGVVEAFVGACALVIGLLKPIRNKELCNIKRDSLSGDRVQGGVFIEHEIGKAGILGINPHINRPIPSIAARAVQLLQVMGTKLSELYKDGGAHSDDLFYLFGRGFKIPGQKSNSSRLNDCLNRFCEVVRLPHDKHGRCWYIRVHEMRKFFMLTFNRHETLGTDDLMGYAAGHFGREYIYDYVDYHQSDSEVVRYHAECIDEKLIAFEAGRLPAENNDGLVAVYMSVLKKFRVTTISSISKSEFMDYLSGMLGDDEFEISTYTVRLEDYDGEVLAIDFALKFGERRDAKFKREELPGAI